MINYSLVENALAPNPNGYVAVVSSPETKNLNDSSRHQINIRTSSGLRLLDLGVFFIPDDDAANEIRISGYLEILPSKLHFKIPVLTSLGVIQIQPFGFYRP